MNHVAKNYLSQYFTCFQERQAIGGASLGGGIDLFPAHHKETREDGSTRGKHCRSFDHCFMDHRSLEIDDPKAQGNSSFLCLVLMSQGQPCSTGLYIEDLG